MNTPKQKCTNCIHQEVCSIYEYAKKYNEECSVRFRPSSMVEVCGKYYREMKNV